MGLADGLEILACEGFSVSQSQDGRLIRLETQGEGSGKLTLSLRSPGSQGDAASLALSGQGEGQMGGSGNE